ncbi:MAG: hypothetical protein RO009_03185 [Pseudorhodoplanes sp.]|jgi:hypothetical protein|nr:hypothetical protein [Pseudorhodoplanes sp.]
MHIVTLVAGADGHVRILATRAPDLARRQIAAETGDAYLVYCGVAPPQIGSRAFVVMLRQALDHAHLGNSTFALSPNSAIRTVYLLLAVTRLQRDLQMLVRLLKRLFRR